MKKKIFSLGLLLFVFLYGCAKKEVPPIAGSPPLPQKEERAKPSEKEQEKEQKLGEEKRLSLEDLLKELDKKELDRGEDKKIDWEKIRLYGRGTPPLFAIFFDFDDYAIRSDMWDRIRSNVKFLLEKRDVKIVLEGNCDERGTNEYNLALGMKRALEVKKALMRLGIDESRIEVISFGEERPICTEQDESCYALNRRVDFVINRKLN